MKCHSCHKKKNRKNNPFSYKRKTRNQRKRKFYMNKPKSKKKRNENKVVHLGSIKANNTIDYTTLRESSIRLYSCMTPNLNFDIVWKFYYDETNNFKKLHIKNRDDFNANIEDNFVLGGLCHDRSVEIDEALLFSNIKLQKTANEVKLTHIANGDFLDILKSSKLTCFLENLRAMPLYLHYQSLNPLYYSLVDIIDSNHNEKHFEFNRVLKATIYDVLKSNLNKTKEIIKKYSYPDIDKNDARDFIHDLIDLTEGELKKSSFLGEEIRLRLLLEFLRDTEDVDELVFLSDEDEYIMIKRLNELYSQNTVMFINSEHIFDNESDVQNSFAEVKMVYKGKDICNYSFVDSKSSVLVQASDVIIGIIGKLFSFIKSIDVLSLDDVISSMNDIQTKNLDLLLALYNKSLAQNPSFINSIESDSELVKLNALNKTRGFT